MSFVIPTRNQAPFIRRCIDVCLAQQLPNAEVLVMDGLSTDGTQETLAGYGDRLCWVSEKGDGQSDAVNRGVARATGDMIAWINSDDYYAGPHIVPRALALFAADRRLDIVHGEGVVVDVAGRPIQRFRSLALPSAKSLLFSPASPILQPATFFRHSLFLDVGGLDRSLHFSMDYDLRIRMWGRSPHVRYVPETWVNATYHEGEKSVRNMREQIREVVALKRRYAPQLGLTAADWLRLGVSVASSYCYGTAIRVGLYQKP